MSTINPTGGGLWEKTNNEIPSNTLKEVSSFPLSSFLGLKFIILTWNATNGLSKMREYSIVKNSSGNDVKTSCFGLIGGGISHDILFEVTNEILKIKINNKENYQVNTEIAFLRLGQ